MVLGLNEVVPVGDEGDVGPVLELHAQIEGRLKPPNPPPGRVSWVYCRSSWLDLLFWSFELVPSSGRSYQRAYSKRGILP